MIDNFVKKYLETALWSTTDDYGKPLDKNYYIGDCCKELIQQAVIDCNKFREIGNSKYNITDDMAHDFWLTRNYHGAGFWDGDYEKEMGDYLTELSHSFGEIFLYTNDGKIYY